MNTTLWKKLDDIITPAEAVLFVTLAFIAIEIPHAFAFHYSPLPVHFELDIFVSCAVVFYIFRKDKDSLKKKPQAFHTNSLHRYLQWASCMPLFTILHYGLNLQGYSHFIAQGGRFLLLPTLIGAVAERGHDKIFPKRFKFMAVALVTTVLLNGLACIWLFIYPSNEDPVTAYIKAMYWLVTTIATVGYGDITPTTNVGRIYAMFMMILGAGIWGILIASASRLMLASDRRKEQKKEKMEALQSFFNHYDIPKNLRSQVVGFYNHLLSQKISDDERAVLNELPAALQGELQSFMNLRPISRISLFQNVSFECLSQASKRLEQRFFAPGESIIKKGDLGNEMFLIGHGIVNVHIGDQFITSLSEGQCFGEFALIGDGIRATDVTAAGYCDVFILSKEKFDELFRAHADLRTNIEKVVQNRAPKPTLKSAS